MIRADLDRRCRIMVAPNGARRQKADHPALPVTAGEVAAAAAACRAAGAHTLDPEIYARYIAAVREAADDGFFVQVTTEAAGRYRPAEQMAAIRGLPVLPDGVSLALRELLPDGADHAAASDFLAWLVDAGIVPQVILYAPEELTRFRTLRDAGVVPSAIVDLLFVLGRYLAPGEVVEPRALLRFLAVADAPPERWMACAFGREETACLVTAAALGGDVRVGFENALWHGDGRLASDNADRVAELAALIDRLGRARLHPPPR